MLRRFIDNKTSGRATVAILFACVLALILFSACFSDAHRSSRLILVSAAVSLKDAFVELGQLHEQRTGIKIQFNFGASGALQKQIEAGAPVDVFASAGAKQMDELNAKGLIVSASKRDFAGNVLVLIQPLDGAPMSSFADLAKPVVKKIAMGNPKTVPAGQYTQQTFNRMKLLPGIQPKLIYAEDVRQVLDYVVRGEVDAGVVYSSDAQAAGSSVRIIARAPDDAHDPILYPIAIVDASKKDFLARKFIELLLSPEGQSILAKHGFVPVSGSAQNSQ